MNEFDVFGVWSNVVAVDVDVTAVSVTVTPGARTMTSIGDSLQLVATAIDANTIAIPGKPITWGASTGNVLTVTSTGLVEASAQGTATVTASADLASGTATIIVDQAIDTIEVTAPADTLAAGMPHQMVATAFDQRGNGVLGAVFTWQTSDSTIATIDTSSGMLSGGAGGDVTVSAFAEGKRGDTMVRIVPLAAAVRITPAYDTIVAFGEEVVLTAVAEDANGVPIAGKTFTWESSDSSVAVFVSAGVGVRAVGNGTAIITAATDTVSGSATFVVAQVVDSVAVTAPADSLITGATHQFAAQALDRGGSLIVGAPFLWTSSDAAVATVGSAGLVTGVASGVVTISATSGSVSGARAVFFWPLATSVVIGPGLDTLTSIGDTARLVATALDTTGVVMPGKVPAWSSSDMAIAIVDSTGLVTAVSLGTATIRADIDTVFATATIVVAQAVDTIIVTSPADSLFTGVAHQFMAEARDPGGAVIPPGTVLAWQSSDTLIATVDSVGRVTGVSTGQVTISATSGSVVGQKSVFFWPVAVAVDIAPTLGTFTALGDTIRFTGAALDAQGDTIVGKKIEWISSDESVVTIDSAGLVIAVDNGTATITATVDSASGTASITVAQVIQSVVLSSPGDTLFINGNYQFLASALDPFGSPVVGATFTWGTSDTTLATIDAAGVLSVLSAGEVIVRGTSGPATDSGRVQLAMAVLPSSGLAAFFPFTGHANDVSGMGHLGTVSGASFVDDRSMNPNAALQFDGVNDVVSLGNTLQPTVPATFTAWVRTDDLTRGLQWLFRTDDRWGFVGGGTITIGLWGFVNGDRFGARLGGHCGGYSFADPRSKTTSDSVMREGIWQHIAIVYETADIRLYVDGIERFGSYDGGCSQVSYDNGGAAFGGGGFGGTVFEGAIDDMRVFGRALTSQEIVALVSEDDYMPPTIDSIAILADSSTIEEGSSVALTVTAFDASGAPVYDFLPSDLTWASADPSVALVDSLGSMVGIAPGSTSISMGVDNGADTLAVVVNGPGLQFASVSTGANHTCALTVSGNAYCWGANPVGQLGDASLTSSLSPVAVAGGITFASISAGNGISCGLTSIGQAYCWGANDVGQVGDGTTSANRIVPTLVAGGLTLSTLDVGRSRVCGLTTVGQAYCWGSGIDGVLGNGGTANVSSPDSVHGGLRYTSISSGVRTACAISTGGETYCWGQNGNAEFGNGSTTGSSVPTLAANSIAFSVVSTDGDANGGSACGVDAAGAGWCWGRNNDGQLGDGSTSQRLLPVPMTGGLTWSTIDAGGFFACGITVGGLGYCWGDNSSGQLGNSLSGNVNDSTVPVAVWGERTLVSLSVDFHHACGVTASGAVYCWGFNTNGEIGDGTSTSRSRPARVPDPS